jgi:hypothetical protein
VIVTLVWLATFTCPTENVTDVFPAGTLTVAGTLATFGCDELKFTKTPPAGAGPFKVTVPVTTFVELPWTEVGATVTVERESGPSISVAFAL